MHTLYKNRMLIYATFLFSFGLIVTYVVLDTYFAAGDIKKILLKNAKDKVELRQEQLREFTTTAQETLYSLRFNDTFLSVHSDTKEYETLHSLFLTVATSHMKIMQLRYIDQNGQELVRVERSAEGQIPFVIQEENLQNKADRDYFEDSKNKALEEVWFSSLDLNIEHGKVQVPFQPTLRAVLPLTSRSGEFSGILIINYFMESLLEKLSRSNLYDILLCDVQGYPLIHYEKEKSWGAYKDHKYNIQAEFKNYQEFLENKEYKSEEYYASRLELPFANTLVLIMKLNEKHVKNEIVKNIEYHVALGLVLTLISFILSVLLSRAMKSLGYELEKSKKYENIFRGIFEHAAIGIMQNNLHGNLMRTNTKALKIMDCTTEELMQKHLWEWTHPDDWKEEKELVEQMRKGEISHYYMQKRILTSRHEIRWVEVSVSVLLDAHEKVSSIITLIQDITKSREDIKKLRQSATVFDNTTEGILITNAKTEIINTNKAFTQITGYTLGNVQGKTPAILQSGRYSFPFYKEMWDELQERGSWSGEIHNKRKNGEIYPQWLNISCVKDANGIVENYIAVFSDITKRKLSEEKIYYLSNHDQLTGLPNRHLLQNRLEYLLEGVDDRVSKVAVVMLDIDDFKQINDVYGHAIGDRVVFELAKTLEECCKEVDIIARSGGDEFVVAIEGVESLEQLQHTVDKLTGLFPFHVTVKGHHFTITASMGISVAPDDALRSATLLKNADAAMYAAKADGKHTAKYFNQKMAESIQQRVLIQNALQEAIKNEEFEVYFQAQLCLSDDTLIGSEALVRWKNSALGEIYPDQFIPIAEETKQIIPLGEIVLKKALKTMKKWREDKICEGRVAVNVSGRQLEDAGFIPMLQAALREYDVDPRYLEIEVTESVIMNDPQHWIDTLEEIKSMGIAISMDDFGTGYSSLAYLRKLPFDTLKIDKSFIDDIPLKQDACAIVDTIIQMGHNLGMSVLAEGVETQDQKEYLKAQGCDYIQGYLLSRPKSEKEMREFLADVL